ncbi:alpha-(1-_3)-arabinofuranosyltransferase domain-containing protein [Nocardioides ochotonae]|uniref:alpha-(1->3)-arabinofuranosyltransferase domain-containing protein n=1 Tax=Nocardioides ochotonae TaxID=2685869 RepID=UPI00140B0056
MGPEATGSTASARAEDPHRDRPARLGPAGAAALVVYALIAIVSLLQQPGRATYDTRAELTERPRSFLGEVFTLWHPESSFGEFQNQAYGYLFPQGMWFLLTDWLGVADWVSQRIWSALVLIVAIEGARRLAAALGLPGAAALLAGLAFGFTPRLLGTVSVITGESLPGAMLPWVVLPVVLAMQGRIGRRSALLLSGAAVVCMGGVNAVENAGALPVAIIVVVWGLRRGLLSRRFVAGWAAVLLAASFWWTLPLLLLAGYAPPFYEYVESAANTTVLIGPSEAIRGDSHWVAYLISGDQSWWPAAHALVSERDLIVLAAVISAIGLYGLLRLQHAIRGPLVLSMLVGLAALTVAHGGWGGSLLAGEFRVLLDGALQIFRNVHKIDPTVRLPLAIGFGHAVVLITRWVAARWPRHDPRALVALVMAALVMSLGQPYLFNDSRTPGWTEVSEPWQEAQRYLIEHQGETATLILPGSGFAQQDWGWTIDEPLLLLGGVNRVVRSQVPLVPGQTIRFLHALDQLATTGRATPRLGAQLARAGIGHVVLRRDLRRDLTGSPHPGGAAVSLANGGLRSVAQFGEGEGGPAVEVLAVEEELPVLRTTLTERVLTVRGAPESVLAVQETGLVSPGTATVLEGEDGWEREADVVTDGNQRRERAFGVNDESVSAVLTADEPWRLSRAAHDFPAVSGTAQVVARYDGLRRLTASSAQGYADNFGPVLPQSAPYAAVDGDRQTRWVSSYATDPTEQWIRMELDEPRRIREVSVLPVVEDDFVVPIRELEVRAGDQVRRVRAHPSGAPSIARFDGRPADVVEVRVVRAATPENRGRVGLREITIDERSSGRSLVVPGMVGPDARLVFGADAERRACRITVGIPDCDVGRIRAPEERSGLDRTFTTSARTTHRLSGWAVARATRETSLLLDPLDAGQRVGASSVYGGDPKVAQRFAHDGLDSTVWMSADNDQNPTLVFEWVRPRTISGVAVVGGESEDIPRRALLRTRSRVVEASVTGTEIAAWKPLRTTRLEVTFLKRYGSDRVVVPEIRLAGADVTRPLDDGLEGGRVGRPCGFGPNIVVDGQVVPTEVWGSVADIVNGSPMRWESCAAGDGSATAAGQPSDGLVRLGPGVHRVQARNSAEFAVTRLLAEPVRERRNEAGRPGTGRGADREVTLTRWEASDRTAVVATGPEALLHLPENANPGWEARVDGEELRRVRVDGWQQAWVLPASGEVTVELSYAPQRVYTVLLPLGLGVSGLVLLAGIGAGIGLWWRRRRGTAPGIPESWATLSPRASSPAVVGLSAVAVFAFLGPVATVGLVLALVAGRVVAVSGSGALAAVTGALGWWRDAAPALVAAVLVVASALLDVAGLPWLSRGADVLAAVAIGLAAGLLLARRPAPLLAPRTGRNV